MLNVDYRYLDLSLYFYCCSCYFKLLVDKEPTCPDPKSYQSLLLLSMHLFLYIHLLAARRFLKSYTFAWSMAPLQMLVYVLFIL